MLIPGYSKAAEEKKKKEKEKKMLVLAEKELSKVVSSRLVRALQINLSSVAKMCLTTLQIDKKSESFRQSVQEMRVFLNVQMRIFFLADRVVAMPFTRTSIRRTRLLKIRFESSGFSYESNKRPCL